MSGQMSDVVVIGDEEFALVEPVSGSLFDVRAHGLKPVMMHTASTRGELARYRVDGDGNLLLSDLQVGSVDAPPELNGVTPSTDEYGQVWTYLELDLPIAFTGDIIVGADPILDLYVHTGFLPAWHYERVTALDVEQGIVQSSEDRTAEVAAYRAERSGPDAVPEEEGAFERFLDSIKLRLGFGDEDAPTDQV